MGIENVRGIDEAIKSDKENKKKEKLYCIKNKCGDYWHNEFGWVKIEAGDEGTFSIFTEKEKKIFNLPIGEGVYWKEF